MMVKSEKILNGKSRVIIENIQPVVDNGLYPTKRTVGERVDVTAHIFADGHDHIRASLFYKKEKDEHWIELPLMQMSIISGHKNGIT
jgi:starch synthase (maltosyl-transferring)